MIIRNSSLSSKIGQSENSHCIYACRKGPDANKVSEKYFPLKYNDILDEFEEDEGEFKHSFEIEVTNRKEAIILQE